MISRLSLFLGFVFVASSAASQSMLAHAQIDITDVQRFFAVYDAAHANPTAVQLDRAYLAPGSAGLHEFAKLRTVTGQRIRDAISEHPKTYASARQCLRILPAVKRRLETSFRKLQHLYPRAKLAPVTIVVGRGRPVGITNPSGVTIGVEALCAADFLDPDVGDRFVHTIAHEYGHIQQSPRDQALEPGEPGATVLRLSLIEGVGEFTAELISGGVSEYQHRALRETQAFAIESKFVRDEDKTDVSDWLYNGPGDGEHQFDLGYWVGYRIVKAYYEHARDKRAALRQIYHINDPKAFLDKSGWRPQNASLTSDGR